MSRHILGYSETKEQWNFEKSTGERKTFCRLQRPKTNAKLGLMIPKNWFYFILHFSVSFYLEVFTYSAIVNT